MKSKRFSVEQIVSAIKQHEGGASGVLAVDVSIAAAEAEAYKLAELLAIK